MVGIREYPEQARQRGPVEWVEAGTFVRTESRMAGHPVHTRIADIRNWIRRATPLRQPVDSSSNGT